MRRRAPRHGGGVREGPRGVACARKLGWRALVPVGVGAAARRSSRRRSRRRRPVGSATGRDPFACARR